MSENSDGKKGMGTGAKVGIGCGVGCLGLVVIMVIAGFAGWQWIEKMVNEFEAEFVEKGMTAAPFSQMLEITEPPNVPTFYKGQIVTLNFSEPVTVDIGVIGQQIEIVQGEFQKNVYCRGQIVVVNPTVKIAGELNVKCQVIQDRGATIGGGVTGQYSAKQ